MYSQNAIKMIVDEGSKDDFELVKYVIESNKGKNRIGEVLPFFETRTIDDLMFSSQDLSEISFITIWHSKCAPCVAEIPILNELKGKYGDKVSFYGITFEEDEILKNSIRKYGFDFENLIMEQEAIQNLSFFGGYPTNLIIIDGVIIYCHYGGPPPSNSKFYSLMVDALKSKYMEVLDVICIK